MTQAKQTGRCPQSTGSGQPALASTRSSDGPRRPSCLEREIALLYPNQMAPLQIDLAIGLDGTYDPWSSIVESVGGGKASFNKVRRLNHEDGSEFAAGHWSWRRARRALPAAARATLKRARDTQASLLDRRSLPRYR